MEKPGDTHSLFLTSLFRVTEHLAQASLGHPSCNASSSSEAASGNAHRQTPPLIAMPGVLGRPEGAASGRRHVVIRDQGTLSGFEAMQKDSESYSLESRLIRLHSDRLSGAPLDFWRSVLHHFRRTQHLSERIRGGERYPGSGPTVHLFTLGTFATVK